MPIASLPGHDLSTGYPPNWSLHPMFGFSSGCYSECMKPQYSSRLRRIPPKVHNEIRRYRLQIGKTQRELARELGVGLSTFSSWERGMTCPSVKMVFKLARYLNTLGEGLYPDFYMVQKENQVTAERA
jgi:DNA-binding XRE family transcriptional regulator